MKIQFLSCLFIGGLALKGNTQTVTVNVLDDKSDGSCTVQHCSFREAIAILNEGKATTVQFDPNLTDDTLWLEEPLPDLIADNCLIQGGGHRGVVLSTKAAVSHGWKISATRATLKGLNFSGFAEFGMKLDSLAAFVFLLDNQFNFNGKAGLYIEGANNISVGQIGQPNRIIGNKKIGISLAYQNFSSLVTVEGNLIEENAIGISGIGLSLGSYLGNNTFKNDVLTGISIVQSEGTRIFYNKLYGGAQQGILLDQSNNIIVQENLLVEYPIGILQKEVGVGNRITHNQFTCIAEPLVWEEMSQGPRIPNQICYDSSIIGFSNPFSRIEIYRLNGDSCSENSGSSWTFIREVQADQSGWWQYDPADPTVQEIAAIAIDALGNTSVFSSPVSKTVYPEVFLEADSIICSGDSSTLLANLGQFTDEHYEFFWLGSQGFEQKGLMVKETLSSGWYSFGVTKDYCSKLLDSVFLKQNDLDTVRIGPSYGPLCFDAEIEIEGIVFNSNNSRQTLIKGGTEGACDTVVEIDLEFLEAPIEWINPSICRTDTFMWGSEIFFEGRSHDTFVLPNVGQNGCDSIIILEVNFIDHPVKKYQGNLCSDDFEMINGVKYDINHPNGEYWIAGENSKCDTLVEVSFDFHWTQYDTIRGTYCEGSQFMVNEVIYDVNHPKGVEYMTNKYGCDSVIYIELSFDFNTIHYLDTILCDNEELLINGNVYNRNLTSGMEQFVAGGNVNCDSIVYVEITYTDRQGEVALPSIISVEQGGTLTIDPIINFVPATITWSSNLDLSCNDCLGTLVTGDREGWINLSVTDVNGCGYEAMAEVKLVEVKNDIAYIPNAFSPNGDGINDILEVFPNYSWVSEVGHLKIVDRWGQVVYHSDYPKWDGTIDGRVALTGIYLYVVEFIMKDGSIQNQTGSVFLHR
ncbi:MAG: hypothetical protein RLZZ248_506 [Bacteroidota bacterium]